MYKIGGKGMSFNFASNNINQFKAQAAYKDGGGMGGGGMYMKQNKKRQNSGPRRLPVPTGVAAVL